MYIDEWVNRKKEKNITIDEYKDTNLKILIFFDVSNFAPLRRYNRSWVKKVREK